MFENLHKPDLSSHIKAAWQMPEKPQLLYNLAALIGTFWDEQQHASSYLYPASMQGGGFPNSLSDLLTFSTCWQPVEIARVLSSRNPLFEGLATASRTRPVGHP